MIAALVGLKLPIVGGNARIAAAKMIGITPAMFTLSGMYVEPPRVSGCRAAARVLDRDSPLALLTKTTATMIPRAISGKKSSRSGRR